MAPANFRATAGASHRSLGLLTPASARSTASCGHSWKIWEIVSWPFPHHLQAGSTSGRRRLSYERRAHLLLIQMRQTCINRNECILLACNVGIIWPSAHMRVVSAQRLTLLADGVRRALGMSAASCEVSNPQLAASLDPPQWIWDLSDAPAVALRFAGAIGLIPGLC